MSAGEARAACDRVLPEVDYSGGAGSRHVELLNERLAKGEITLEEYQRIRSALSER